MLITNPFHSNKCMLIENKFLPKNNYYQSLEVCLLVNGEAFLLNALLPQYRQNKDSKNKE